jgi:hypothetical protein
VYILSEFKWERTQGSEKVGKKISNTSLSNIAPTLEILVDDVIKSNESPV